MIRDGWAHLAVEGTGHGDDLRHCQKVSSLGPALGVVDHRGMQDRDQIGRAAPNASRTEPQSRAQSSCACSSVRAMIEAVAARERE